MCEGCWKVVHAPTKDQDLWREQVATGGKSTLEGWIVTDSWFHSVSACSSGGKLQLLAFFGWGTDPVIRFDGAASHSSDSVGCPIEHLIQQWRMFSCCTLYGTMVSVSNRWRQVKRWPPFVGGPQKLWIGAWLRFRSKDVKGLNDFQENPAWDGFSNKRFSILFLNQNPFPAWNW